MKTLAVLALAVAVAAAADEMPASEPTCPNGDASCGAREQKRPPICSIWYDGEYVFSGQAGLQKGDSVGEPDVVIPWHNHDRWVWTTWHRYNQMFENGDKDEHIFAPGFHYPYTCHKSLANLQVSDPSIDVNNLRVASAVTANDNFHSAVNQSVPLKANRAIVRGDALFTTCRHPDLSSKVALEDVPKYVPGYFRDECTCMDVITPAPSTIPNAGIGAFSKYQVPKGATVIFAVALHMLRSELHNETSNQDELLLNYAFGDPTGQTPLLLLPSAPGVNYINHASNGKEPNVKIAWSLDPDDRIENHFNTDTSHVIFARSERPKFFIKYMTLKAIQPGDELLLDYGTEWEAAWNRYVESCGGNDQVAACSSTKPFRHAIGVPKFFYPQAWLNIEGRGKPKFTWDLVNLPPGTVQQLAVKETGANPMSYGHRVGLPVGFTDKIRDYAERSGITDIMRKYVVEGQPLELDGTQRHRINGGTWWVKRFNSEWESNMHYITPDDERSNDDFMSALGEAGFDQVLEALGEYFGLDGLICYYASFIAVSHCSGSYPHVDAEETNGKGFNLLFPVVHANETTPEIMLGEDGFGPLVIPYRYEEKHAIVLGDDGVHHTSPADYRRNTEMRMVVSIYMADINEKNRWKIFWDASMDPPYPRVQTRMRYLMKNAGVHWKRGTDNKLPVRDESFA